MIDGINFNYGRLSEYPELQSILQNAASTNPIIVYAELPASNNDNNNNNNPAVNTPPPPPRPTDDGYADRFRLYEQFYGPGYLPFH